MSPEPTLTDREEKEYSFPETITSKRGIVYTHICEEDDYGRWYAGYYSYEKNRRYPKLCVRVEDQYGIIEGRAEKLRSRLQKIASTK